MTEPTDGYCRLERFEFDDDLSPESISKTHSGFDKVLLSISEAWKHFEQVMMRSHLASLAESQGFFESVDPQLAEENKTSLEAGDVEVSHGTSVILRNRWNSQMQVGVSNSGYVLVVQNQGQPGYVSFGLNHAEERVGFRMPSLVWFDGECLIEASAAEDAIHHWLDADEIRESAIQPCCCLLTRFVLDAEPVTEQHPESMQTFPYLLIADRYIEQHDEISVVLERIFQLWKDREDKDTGTSVTLRNKWGGRLLVCVSDVGWMLWDMSPQVFISNRPRQRDALSYGDIDAVGSVPVYVEEWEDFDRVHFIPADAAEHAITRWLNAWELDEEVFSTELAEQRRSRL